MQVTIESKESRTPQAKSMKKLGNKAFTFTNFSNQPHHRLANKAESYSVKGFGNGFVSQANRFTGVDERKFMLNTNLYIKQEPIN